MSEHHCEIEPRKPLHTGQFKPAAVYPVDPITPTLRQRVIASGWPLTVWWWAAGITSTVVTASSIGPTYSVFSDVWAAAMLVLASVLSFLLGFFISVPVALVVFGPIFMEQGLQNGGPFKPGDVVQVISGPYRNVVSRAYGTSQYETVRVDVGEDAKANYTDIFAAYQLLRINVDGYDGPGP